MKIMVKIALSVMTILAGMALEPLTVLAWGDSDGGRQEYTQAEIGQMAEDGTWEKERIVFNSTSDGAVGHEFNYVGAREYTDGDGGGDRVWNADEITVEDGRTYIVRLYIDNNNPYGYEGMAEDTKVSFNIPAYSASTLKINGFITASNATPYEYVDYVDFNSANGTPFHLEVDYESALLENGGFALGGVSLDGRALTDASLDGDGSWNGGVLIGYDALDGKIPGGIAYDGVVTICVKAVYDYEFTTEIKVRLEGRDNAVWLDSVEAEVGDRIEILIGYENTSGQTQSNVAVRNLLPENLQYIEGSTMLKNSNHPDGAMVNEDYLVTEGILVGSYGPGANAYITLAAEVVDANLADGSNTLVNWGQVSVGETVIQDFAKVTVQKTEKTNTIIGIFMAVILVLVCLAAIIMFSCKIWRLRKSRRNRH